MKLTFDNETLDERNGLLFWLQADGWLVRRPIDDALSRVSGEAPDTCTLTLYSPATVAKVKQSLAALAAEG